MLAAQVDLRTFAARQQIYKIGDSAGRAYVLLSGAVRVATIDEDQQEVAFDEPAAGDFFGFASLLDDTPHQTTAIALEESVCIEVERDDIVTLVQRQPHAAMDMMAVRLGTRAWDPYPFILLNLILSMLAAIQAPAIMMSQNRQDKKDRLRGELDFQVNRSAAAEIKGVAGKLNQLIEKVGDLDDELRAARRDSESTT